LAATPCADMFIFLILNGLLPQAEHIHHSLTESFMKKTNVHAALKAFNAQLLVKLGQFLTFVLLFCWGCSNIHAQSCYNRMIDASGLNTDEYQSSLTSRACRLRDSFPNSNAQTSFAVYDFGFYLFQGITTGT
jgi:hypothetical protein